ncbi:glutamine-fructose-6-phosphate transaminase [Streptomyces pristinaespiralis ATCC 25486]|uniref:Glutamine-fructose-6-phosphate transaminase n=1 Tax=Streptomyces pristinaespiralis (strain ATCC 25486 / DSM 40338 / CBS 914.69 / JCM 4507 / KCC S-0507 / NBRC 13074 / NRRL 2958 / 5647) TaxID=457429 RepID=B5HB82_STRE2|nr:glutamine-fructose-6-phosphate transaminase [Streptomyces pristinaespiralis ATCC 25486]
MSATTSAEHEEHPGRIMSGEMAQQPAVLRRILDEGAPRIRQVASAIAAKKPRFVLLTARGTSDNAALYAKYLIEIRLGLPCGLTSMSTTTAYGARPSLADVLVITISQSGGSPDLVASTKAAREAGAVTLAVTNNPDSPLAAVSEFSIDIMAGPEKALPATKTYTASLMALHLRGGSARWGGAGGRAGAGPGRADPRPAGRGARAGLALPLRRAHGHHVAGLRLPDGEGGGAQAHGDQLHPRAGVLRRGPAARAARHGGQRLPGDRGGAGRQGRRGAPAGARPAPRPRGGPLRGGPGSAGRGRVRGLRTAHGGRAGRAPADSGDPSAATARVRSDHRAGAGPGRPEGAGEGDGDALSRSCGGGRDRDGRV